MKSSQSKKFSIKKERIRKLPDQISDPKFKKGIFNHWQKIPVIKEIPEPMPLKLVKQEVRSEILDVLRKGIEEYDEKQDLIEVRHVFSAKELHKLIKERLSIKIKISNVYFHLNKLLDKGYVQIVTSIKEGRQITHFYGRTARLFLWMGEPLDTTDVNDESKFSDFIIILKRFNPDLTSVTINELFRSFLQVYQETHGRAKKWMEKNIEILTELNVDTRDVYKSLRLIDRSDSKTIETYNKIMKLLNFPEE